ncbi:MAG: hypothetical protein KGY99_11000 [Phycisphaerae bacterium]|nr:hypothetical protein [Phycisphaerae bacterium]
MMGHASFRGLTPRRGLRARPTRTLEVRTNGDADPLKQYPPSPGGSGRTGVTAGWVCTSREYLRAEHEADLTASLRRHEYGRPLGELSFLQHVGRLLGRNLVPKKPGRKPKKEKQLVSPPIARREMSRRHGIQIVCAAALMVWVAYAPAAPPASPEGSVTEDVGALRLVFDGAGARGAALSASKVVLFQAGDSIASKTTRFREPMIFRGLPSGELRVEVVPIPGEVAAGFSGEAMAEVVAGEMTTARVPLRRIESSPVSITTVGLDGEVYAEKPILVRDITGGTCLLERKARTDEAGRYVLRAFPEHTYVLVTYGKHLYEYRSALLTTDDAKADVTWRLSHGKEVELVFCLGSEDVPAPAEVIAGVGIEANVGTETRRLGMKLDEGKVCLSKDVGLLAGAERLTVKPRGSHVADYELVGGGVVKLDDSDHQVVRLVLRPKKQAAVMVNCRGLAEDAGPARVYVVSDNEKLYRGQSGRAAVLPFGTYRVYAWREGYRLAEAPLHISDRASQELSLDMTKAQMHRIRVTGPDGKPPAEVHIELRYPGKAFLPSHEWRMDAKGVARGPVDDRAGPVLIARDIALGCVVATPEKVGRPAPQMIAFRRPCELAGRAPVELSETDDGPERQWLVLWVRADTPRVVAGVGRVKDGAYTAYLQPGMYDGYLTTAKSNKAFPLKRVVIVAGEAAKRVNLPTVGDKQWAKRKRLRDYKVDE